MKASLKLEVNGKIIELSLLEAIELREQLNNLTGIGEVDPDKKEKLDDSGYITYPSYPLNVQTTPWTTMGTTTAQDPNITFTTDSATTLASTNSAT